MPFFATAFIAFFFAVDSDVITENDVLVVVAPVLTSTVILTDVLMILPLSSVFTAVDVVIFQKQRIFGIFKARHVISRFESW